MKGLLFFLGFWLAVALVVSQIESRVGIGMLVAAALGGVILHEQGHKAGRRKLERGRSPERD